jgi:type IV secretory pathway TrbD component
MFQFPLYVWVIGTFCLAVVVVGFVMLAQMARSNKRNVAAKAQCDKGGER